MFSYDPKSRPTLEDIRNHPWIKAEYNEKEIRQAFLDKLQEKRSQKTSDSSTENQSRAFDDGMLHIVREVSQAELDLYKFNDMTDHDIDITPADFWETLEVFNTDIFDDQLQLFKNDDKKFFKLTYEDSVTGTLEVKIKIFDLGPEGEDTHSDSEEGRRFRVRFVKKRGDLSKWYEILHEMLDTVFADVLLAPKSHHFNTLTCSEALAAH